MEEIFFSFPASPFETMGAIDPCASALMACGSLTTEVKRLALNREFVLKMKSSTIKQV